MPGAFIAVAVAAVVMGGVHLAAYYGRRPRLAGVAKAVPIFLLFCWVLSHAPVVGEGYRRLIAAGLLFSMGGDLLLLSRERFRAGLASFFVAHVGYALAFLSGPFEGRTIDGVTLAVAAGMILRILWPHVRRERVPVACYVVMISFMAWAALGLEHAMQSLGGGLGALGAFVFMTSDAILALDRFVRPWRGAHAAVMITYYAAQILIAASVASGRLTTVPG